MIVFFVNYSNLHVPKTYLGTSEEQSKHRFNELLNHMIFTTLGFSEINRIQWNIILL